MRRRPSPSSTDSKFVAEKSALVGATLTLSAIACMSSSIRVSERHSAEHLVETDFEDHFCQCGNVIKVSLPRYADKRLKGYGFIHFEESESGEESAARAITSLSDTMINGVRIVCNFGKRQVSRRTRPPMLQKDRFIHPVPLQAAPIPIATYPYTFAHGSLGMSSSTPIPPPAAPVTPFQLSSPPLL
eukprot:519743_1